MYVKFISCWFATSYGAYTDGLRQAMEKILGDEVGVIASNCGCGDPEEVARKFQDQRCDYFEMPHVYFYKSTNPLKYWLRMQARDISYRQRAKRYLARTGHADVVHFQQTLHALGSMAVFNWLNQSSTAARVVTVHELDPAQVDFPKTNLTYNKADRIIVHAHELRDELIAYGVDSGRIDIVEHGVALPVMEQGERRGIIFYGGHKLASGKGLDTLFAAMALIKDKMGERAPTLTIHGHYAESTPEFAERMAQDAGVADRIRWLNKIDHAQTVREYQQASLCVLPYTGSFAGYAAAMALANGVPVVGTRRSGLPEHVGDLGTWVGENDVQGLARSIIDLLANDTARADLAARGRQRAEQHLTWEAVAHKTLASYRAALESRRGNPRSDKRRLG